MTSTRVPMNQRVLTEEQRQAIAHREAERQRLAVIFQPTGNLNMEAIKLLVAWAEQDEETLGNFHLWGEWDQGHWGNATVEIDDATSEAVGYDAGFDDIEDRAEALDVVDKAILNGACQTAYCMAGQAVVQAGYKMKYDGVTAQSGDLWASADKCVMVEPVGTFDEKGYPVLRETGESESISRVAARILGLTTGKADLFFNGGNEIRELKAYANYFAQEEGLPLPYPDHDVWGGVEDSYEDEDDEPTDEF